MLRAYLIIYYYYLIFLILISGLGALFYIIKIYKNL